MTPMYDSLKSPAPECSIGACFHLKLCSSVLEMVARDKIIIFRTWSFGRQLTLPSIVSLAVSISISSINYCSWRRRTFDHWFLKAKTAKIEFLLTFMRSSHRSSCQNGKLSVYDFDYDSQNVARIRMMHWMNLWFSRYMDGSKYLIAWKIFYCTSPPLNTEYEKGCSIFYWFFIYSFRFLCLTYM